MEALQVEAVVVDGHCWRGLVVAAGQEAAAGCGWPQAFEFGGDGVLAAMHGHFIEAAQEEEVRVVATEAVDVDAGLSFQGQHTFDAGSFEPI